MKQKLVGIVLVVLSCSLVTGLAWAAPTVKAIEVHGNQDVSESSIRGVIQTRVGLLLSRDRIQSDIIALHELGQFHDIWVEQVSTSGGVKLIYHVEEKPRIEVVEIDGNKKVDDDDLFDAVTVKAQDVADPTAISESIQKMKELYQEKGYHLVSIRHSFKSVPQSRNKKLVFEIREGTGLQVKRVNFAGNKQFSDKELGKAIRTKRKTLFSWLSGSGKYRKEVLERDVAFLTFHYLNNGYLRVRVSPPEVKLSRDKKWLYITFEVDEGPQYTVGQVDVRGDILTTSEEMKKMLKTKSGDVYSRLNVEQDMARMSEMYGNQAYAFANIVPQTIPNDETLTTDITFVIEKGQRIKIERINIEGNTVTRDKVIRRELQVVENGFYHESRLRKSRERLMALGFFEEVNFATPRGSTDDHINLDIRVKEKQTGTFSIGAGFSSVENFILTASISKDNFMGYGVSGRFSLELSSRRQLFLLSFEDPYFLDTDWIFSVAGFRTINGFEDFDRRSFGGNVGLGRRVFENSTIRVGYEIEDIDTENFRTTVPEPFEDNLSGLTSATSLTLLRDTRNNRLFPTKGTFASVSNEFAGLGGDNNYYRVIGNARFYKRLFWKVIFKQNFTIGYIESLNNDPVPLFERFFTGGINSLRGFELRSVGPKVRVLDSASGGDEEFIVGGNKLLLLNSEIEVPVYEPAGLKLVIFYDTGNAYAEEEAYSLNNLRHDYGFGMRWNSPFGPMRFEWGFPIDKREGEDSVVFHFTIGSFF